jgi:hypothetical protein
MEAMWSGEEQGLQKELSEQEYITNLPCTEDKKSDTIYL